MSDNNSMNENMVNQMTETEAEMMRQRILNLELALSELIDRFERGAMDSYALDYAKSVLEGEFEE